MKYEHYRTRYVRVIYERKIRLLKLFKKCKKRNVDDVITIGPIVLKFFM